MTNYSMNPGRVRVDFFRASGKWYTTHELDMSQVYHYDDIVNAVSTALIEQFGTLPKFNIVVLEPYHVHEHPVMIRNAN